MNNMERRDKVSVDLSTDRIQGRNLMLSNLGNFAADPCRDLPQGQQAPRLFCRTKGQG